MKTSKKDYTELTKIAKKLNMVPYIDRWGKTIKGQYTLDLHNAPIDLSACDNEEKSILLAALQQLSKDVDDSFHDSIERSFMD